MPSKTKSEKSVKTKRTVRDIFSHGSNVNVRYVPKHEELKALVKNLKDGGYKIVLTQGVYDLIHEGHAKYLEKARALGDVLIVGLDSDRLTKIRKGPNRPIVPQGERINMLVHLRSVDIVTLRDSEVDLGDLIRLVEPDVYVASETTKDFSKRLLDEYKPYCKKIVILPPQAPTSSSERIRTLSIEGVQKLIGEVNQSMQNFFNKIKNG